MPHETLNPALVRGSQGKIFGGRHLATTDRTDEFRGFLINRGSGLHCEGETEKKREGKEVVHLMNLRFSVCNVGGVFRYANIQANSDYFLLSPIPVNHSRRQPVRGGGDQSYEYEYA